MPCGPLATVFITSLQAKIVANNAVLSLAVVVAQLWHHKYNYCYPDIFSWLNQVQGDHDL